MILPGPMNKKLTTPIVYPRGVPDIRHGPVEGDQFAELPVEAVGGVEFLFEVSEVVGHFGGDSVLPDSRSPLVDLGNQ